VVHLSIGDISLLPSATATDNVDGNLTSAIQIDTSSIDHLYNIDTNSYNFIEENEYDVIYSVKDSSDNLTEFILRIIVTDNPPVEEPDYTGYYETLNGLTGQAFNDELYRILNNTGTNDTTTYGEARYILEQSDVWIGNNTDYMYLIYSDTLRGSVNDGYPFDGYGIPAWEGTTATWNREHVWAKSLFGTGNYDPSNSSRGIAADMHNLRAADSTVNSTRSNNKFINQVYVSTGFGNYNGMWYPGDHHRGDVARIIFYMDIRWGSLTDISQIGDLATLIEWHLADPVDDFEIHRNNIIFNHQNNRNPFIDHPEMVQTIYAN